MFYIYYLKDLLKDTPCQVKKEQISLQLFEDRGVTVNWDEEEEDKRYPWGEIALIMWAHLFMSFYMPLVSFVNHN